MSFVGINVGAMSVKVVAVSGDAVKPATEAHQGRPREVLERMLALPAFADAEYFGVSGALGHITEVAAIQRAITEIGGDFDAVASLGGESFLVYFLSNGRIANVLSHNKCAAGSGEFLVQQIGRMGIPLDEAIRRSFAGRVVPLASRCSVHCKSDITHKLNRHEATADDILRSLHDSMASKVVSLLEKSQREARRVLLVGGVSQNAALLAALGEKRPATEFVVRPESAWFDAWGCALLVRDEPRHRRPEVIAAPQLDRLPPLGAYAAQVLTIAPPAREAAGHGPLALGIDAGSTTTKAVVIDAASRGLVASHYARTNADPVAAIRGCLRALAAEIGDRPIGLVATTGSARELAGAYLGTAHVYNEISAHAAGAAHYDPQVDTIFEIGGQDAKYILLRNGAPIDYAMNNACSAGTGSFLEESAHGDLGIGVGDIAPIALAAASPVRFKTTCAAFINSDIRIAQQQGHSREDIVAGLVYSIAGNYLNRVKGPRPVGAKVFLQGGVALNAAVGHAFAHSVGRPVVIPPHPELLGALGVALLALARAKGAGGQARDLVSLAGPEMKAAGRFTCRACKMYCGIDRFEVAGRRFPFGGRCSLFEHSWKRGARTATAQDLVERRAELLFRPRPVRPIPAGQAPAEAPRWDLSPALADARTFLKSRLGLETTAEPPGPVPPKRVGIPRALTTHSLYPLYATFFAALGMEVVVSGIDGDGDMKSNSGFCFPAQLAHGAVLDLERRKVEVVFLPQITRMPQPNGCRDSCSARSPRPAPISSPRRSRTPRSFRQSSISQTVTREPGPGGVRRTRTGRPARGGRAAWRGRGARPGRGRERPARMGNARSPRRSAARPAAVLGGPQLQRLLPRGLAVRGPQAREHGRHRHPRGLPPAGGHGPTSWHFANQIMNSVALVRRHPNVFLLCVSNFSCTIDAFTHSMLAAELAQSRT